MPAVNCDPMKLSGPWTDGFVLERQHTLSSDFIGHDSFGNPQFDTKRTELGELVFRLKNRNDKNTLATIAETAVQFIDGWNPAFDLIIPVPPSRTRQFQPVVEIAKAIGARLSKPISAVAVNKTRNTPELKDVFGYQERINLLSGVFQIDCDVVRGKSILLIDDLYRSGATATVVTHALLAGGAAAIHMLAMTKTRTRT